MVRFSVFVVCAYLLLGIEAIDCYYPSGQVYTGGDSGPCNNTSGVQSMCCRLRNTTTPDYCNKDALCIPYTNDFPWRGTCTDPTWKDPACIHLCMDGQGKRLLQTWFIRIVQRSFSCLH